MMNHNLKLPKTTFVNKFIAKSKFSEKTEIKPKIKKEFTNKIQRITWKYKIAESTINIKKTKRIEEIQVFEIELKEQKIPKNILKLIDKAIPYPILYVFTYKDDFAYGISLIESSDNYYFSEWNQKIDFNFSAINLEIVYQNIIKSFITPETVRSESNFDEIIEKDKKIKILNKEIEVLESKIKKEKQFNRKDELNRQLLEKREELEKWKK